jgi:hypothetical protein
MSYIILRGRWCEIIILNIHDPTEDKIDGVKDTFYKELEQVFDKLNKYHTKIVYTKLCIRKLYICYICFVEFGIPMKLVRLIKMCLNKTYSKVHIGKHLSDNFPFQNGLKRGALSVLLFNFALECAIRKV